VIPLLLLVFGIAIAIGVWRKAGPAEWIWLLFGAAITMLVLWVLLLLFVVGPEMRRSPLPGDQGALPRSRRPALIAASIDRGYPHDLRRTARL
jgi:hypothetical protein